MRNKAVVIPALSVLLVCVVLIASGIGAVSISPLQVCGILLNKIGINTGIEFTTQQEAILIAIRLPRVLLALLVGVALAVSGASLQGLFQNPLTEPGLIGVSSGASLGAVFVVVMGQQHLDSVVTFLGIYAMPIASFLVALLVTILVYKLSQNQGRTIVNTVLLAGIAVNALAAALTGMLIYYANDAQLRSITFWSLGSFGGATWNNVLAIAPLIICALVVLLKLSKPLNAFVLGESNAIYVGVNIERTKKVVVMAAALAVGASVAVSGIIMFVGLVVPHILRLISGPDNRLLLPASALLGGTLLIVADLFSRTIFHPAEVPIGIVTSLIGAPFFIYILLNQRKKQTNF
jgi:iron complex transport system permease protein